MRLGLICLMLIYAAAFILLDVEQKIRGLGIILQLGGFWIAYSGLNARSRLFSEPDLVTAAISGLKLYWSRFKRRWFKGTGGSLNIALESMSISSQGQVSVSTMVVRANEKTLDERVSASEEELKRLALYFRSQLEIHAAQISDIRAETQDDRAHLTQSISHIKDIQTRTLAKGIPSEKMGVALFTIGLLLSSASNELKTLVLSFQ